MAIKEWRWVELQTGLKVKVLGLDGGTEFGFGSKDYQNDKLVAWGRQEGIEIIKTPAHTPWINSAPERAGRAMMEKSRATILEHNIPIELWPLVVDSVVKVMNLLPTKANDEYISPHEVLSRAAGIPNPKPNIKHLRTYYCTAYYHIKKERRVQGDKFAAHSRRGHLVGYADLNGRIFHIWDPEHKQLIKASAVRFLEPDENQSPEEQALDHAVIFSDQSIEEVDRVLESKNEVWITVNRPKPLELISSTKENNKQKAPDKAPPSRKAPEQPMIDSVMGIKPTSLNNPVLPTPSPSVTPALVPKSTQFPASPLQRNSSLSPMPTATTIASGPQSPDSGPTTLQQPHSDQEETLRQRNPDTQQRTQLRISWRATPQTSTEDVIDSIEQDEDNEEFQLFVDNEDDEDEFEPFDRSPFVDPHDLDEEEPIPPTRKRMQSSPDPLQNTPSKLPRPKATGELDNGT